MKHHTLQVFFVILYSFRNYTKKETNEQCGTCTGKESLWILRILKGERINKVRGCNQVGGIQKQLEGEHERTLLNKHLTFDALYRLTHVLKLD